MIQYNRTVIFIYVTFGVPTKMRNIHELRIKKAGIRDRRRRTDNAPTNVFTCTFPIQNQSSKYLSFYYYLKILYLSSQYRYP